MKKAIYSLLFLLVLPLLSLAQPFEHFLGGQERDVFSQIIPTPDGNFLATGSKTIDSFSHVWLVKLSPNGSLLWEKTYEPPSAGHGAYGHGVVLLPDGGILLLGEQINCSWNGVNCDGFAIKTDAAGNLIWRRTYANVKALYDATPDNNHILMVGLAHSSGSSEFGRLMRTDAQGNFQWGTNVQVFNQTRVRRIFKTPDGNFLLIGRTNVIGVGFQGVFLRKIDPDGNQIWQKTVDTGWRENYSGFFPQFFNQPLGALQLTDGTVLVANPFGNNTDISILQFTASGDVIQQRNYGITSAEEEPYALLQLPDGDLLVAGVYYTNAGYQGFSAKIGASGILKWIRPYGDPAYENRILSCALLSDGRALLAGTSNDNAGFGDHDGWLLGMESDGNVLPYRIEGRVVFDLNNNCLADTGEPPAPGWFVQVDDALDRSYVTDQDGRVTIQTGADTTLLSLRLKSPENAWALCSATQTVVFQPSNPVQQVEFLIQSADGGCPLTQVSLTQPDLQRCSTSTFYTTVQNRGVGASGELLLNLTLDPALEVVSASEPFQHIGQVLEFDLPPMEGLEQKTIRVEIKLACDVQLSATHAVVARLLPVECAPNWAGPFFRVEGACSGSAVQFRLRNDGAGQNAETRYRVMADDLLYSDWTLVALPAGAPDHVLSFPADGRTWRVELEQAAGFPGESRPAAAVEACGRGANGLHSIAMLNAWRFDDAAPETAAFLAPNTTGVPNKVTEATRGFGLYNYIRDTDWQEFTLRVRNDLPEIVNEALFFVRCSPNYDLSTFEPLASNAPVKFELDLTRNIRISMTGLNLATGEDAMLRFRIRPLPGTPADSSYRSLLQVDATAFLNEKGPYVLVSGFHNVSESFPLAIDEYNVYSEEFLRFGGRSYDFGVVMAAAPDGSVFLAGESNSYSDRTNTDGFIIKTDAMGRAYWLNAFDLGDQGRNTVRGLIALPDGGCLVAGNHQPVRTTATNVNEHTAYLARLDAAGRLLWHKKYRPSGQPYWSWTSGLVATGDQAYVMYGYCSSELYGTDAFYLKIDEQGNTIWLSYTPINGSAFRPMRGVQLDDGSMVFMGNNNSTVTNFNVFLEKIDANGSKIWSKGYNSLYNIYLGGLALTSDNGFMVNGSAQWQPTPGQLVETPVFVKFSESGIAQWEKRPIIGPFNNASANNLIPAPDGNLYSLGEIFMDTVNRFNDVLLLKTDENGDTLWWRNYGSKNTEWAEDALVTGQDRLLLWGFNQSRPPLFDLQAILVRADLEGNPYVNIQEPVLNPEINIRVFPNPVQSVLWVECPPEMQPDIRWDIIDMYGRVVHSGNTGAALFSIDVSGLPGGMYFLRFPHLGAAAKRILITD